MRKFTKEIAALIASAAIGTAAGVVAFSASPEEMVETAGVAMNPDATICTTELPTTAGVPLPPDAWIESTTEEEFPPLMGEEGPPDEWIESTDPTLPPIDGGIMPPDETIEPTTEEIPPLIGEEWIESTTEEELPPLMGDIAPADGDINGDGSFNADDAALLQKWLLNVSDANIGDWTAADLNGDGKLDVFDLMLMKRDLIEQSSKSFIIPDGYIATFHSNLDDMSKETYIYKINNGAANYGFKYINVVRSSFNIYHTEQVTLTGQGEVMWTDDVFTIAEENNAYDYVTIPNDDKIYTIEEFMRMFLMD